MENFYLQGYMCNSTLEDPETSSGWHERLSVAQVCPTTQDSAGWGVKNDRRSFPRGAKGAGGRGIGRIPLPPWRKGAAGEGRRPEGWGGEIESNFNQVIKKNSLQKKFSM